MIARPIGKPVARLIPRPLAKSVGRPIARLIGKPIGRPAGRPVARLTPKPLAKPVGRPIGGWLVGRLPGCRLCDRGDVLYFLQIQRVF
ncbi:MAG: hypothetical protein ABIL25_04130 [candidate division WOR-3 bacterium]